MKKGFINVDKGTDSPINITIGGGRENYFLVMVAKPDNSTLRVEPNLDCVPHVEFEIGNLQIITLCENDFNYLKKIGLKLPVPLPSNFQPTGTVKIGNDEA